MKEVTHTRRGKQIIDLSTGVVEDHLSLNQAKKRSTAVQKAGGILRKIPRKDKDREKSFDCGRQLS